MTRSSDIHRLTARTAELISPRVIEGWIWRSGVPGVQGAPSSFTITSSFLFLLVRHLLLEAMHLLLVALLVLVVWAGATNSILDPSSDALCY